MTLEQQVCSLELAKRLKELGVRQESLFHWNHYFDKNYPDRIYKKLDDHSLNVPFMVKGTTWEVIDVCSAFTVAELISELQTVAKQDIIVASDSTNVADWLAEKLIEVYAQKSKVQG